MHLDSVYRDAYMFLRSEWSRVGWWSEGEKSMLLALTWNRPHRQLIIQQSTASAHERTRWVVKEQVIN